MDATAARERSSGTVTAVKPKANILTIDVEDWFHVLEAKGAPARESWGSLESRVERNTDRVLELLEERGAKATFFVLGWVARQFPGLVKRIAAAGHELGSHSFWHEVVFRHDAESFRAELRASKQLLEDIAGVAVEAFRAPGHSVTPAEAWAFSEIAAAGYCYDASLCPARSRHGGFPTSFHGPHLLRWEGGELIEIPSATLGWGRCRVRYGGGGYLRLLPLSFLRAAIAADNAMGQPASVYVHPRELDVDQPRMPLAAARRFRYYVGLRTTERKLRTMLRLYRWVGIRSWVAENRSQLLGRVFDVGEMVARARPSPDLRRVPPPIPPPPVKA
jgi:polysaccharide deacetylase family protein (PEP-CTERM system associated)